MYTPDLGTGSNRTSLQIASHTSKFCRGTDAPDLYISLDIAQFTVVADRAYLHARCTRHRQVIANGPNSNIRIRAILNPAMITNFVDMQMCSATNNKIGTNLLQQYIGA